MNLVFHVCDRPDERGHLINQEAPGKLVYQADSPSVRKDMSE